MKVDGSIDKYEARLVIKGYRQRECLDYFDTYSSVTRITLISIATLRNLDVYQIDLKTTFLNGDLDEEIYMNQPEGFIAHGRESKICQLVNSLFGLKQVCCWFDRYDNGKTKGIKSPSQTKGLDLCTPNPTLLRFHFLSKPNLILQFVEIFALYLSLSQSHIFFFTTPRSRFQTLIPKLNPNQIPNFTHQITQFQVLLNLILSRFFILDCATQ